jgi:amino acid efflux transporter
LRATTQRKPTEESSGSSQSLQQSLGFSEGLALYLAAVLGTGILVVPLLAWREGGPASLLAWVLLGVLGLALAWTFASVGAQAPNAGGVQNMIARAMGPKLGALTRYLIYFSVPAGGVAASHILAHHICAGFDLPMSYVFPFAAGCWVVVGTANYFGIRVSARAQLILSSALVVLLTLLILFMLPSVRVPNFHPWAPTGFSGIGRSAVMIFWSFLGWEAIAHLAEEFRNPERDMLRAAVVAAIIIGILYFAVSFVLIGSGGIQFAGDRMAPLVAVAKRLFGDPGRIFAGGLAAVIGLGTMNAYMAGLSRLGYSMARDGDLPRFFAKLDGKFRIPRHSILLQLGMNTCALLIQRVFDLPLKNFFLIPNLAFLVLYVLGSISAARLLRGRRLAVLSAYFSAAVCLAMMPFASGALLYPVIVAGAASIHLYLFARKKI